MGPPLRRKDDGFVTFGNIPNLRIRRSYHFFYGSDSVALSPQPNPRILRQSTTGAILCSHLNRLGVAVELGTELVDFTQDTQKPPPQLQCLREVLVEKNERYPT
ncbi:hypothetical protein BS47DRAFT_1347859 [Hydnum rufescens UP504]|uniref:Uncharacterized protein n=1 Tax=Hydnum rufescens UP504 TaxID=1448309 RepID=A0A9P6ASA9_9AGAM|nr:hypothetical protein BS47DRAFT_1347859 [Hydnum rufescens UP504]